MARVVGISVTGTWASLRRFFKWYFWAALCGHSASDNFVNLGIMPLYNSSCFLRIFFLTESLRCAGPE